MCVTSLEAELKNTYIGVWEVQHSTFGERQVLAYQNSPKNLADGSNCMLLHVQSKQPLTPDCIIDTSQDPGFLQQMAHSILPRGRGNLFGASSKNFVVEMGIYHLALLNDVSEAALSKTLAQIPVEKQPKISLDYLNFYARTFPSFPLILCCFNNQEAKEASPVMVHYEPIHPDVFMFNTLDGHGSLPEVGELHEFHQTIITGSHHLTAAGNGFEPFNLSGISAELLPWLPQYGTALKIDQTLPNEDLLIDAAAIRHGGDADMRLGLLN